MKRHYDVLVIGTGIAGLSAAYRAAQSGLSVIIVTKTSDISESNTAYAQGGIVETGAGDSPELLEFDITRAGSGINNLEAIRILAKDGPKFVSEYLVEKAGVPFGQHQPARGPRKRRASGSSYCTFATM